MRKLRLKELNILRTHGDGEVEWGLDSVFQIILLDTVLPKRIGFWYVQV